jgi:hypothetical protein
VLINLTGVLEEARINEEISLMDNHVPNHEKLEGLLSGILFAFGMCLFLLVVVLLLF